MNPIIQSLLADDVIREQKAELERLSPEYPPVYFIEWPAGTVLLDFYRDENGYHERRFAPPESPDE